ncbi:protein adenylyltransferase SelO [Leucobacter sp. HY1910]
MTKQPATPASTALLPLECVYADAFPELALPWEAQRPLHPEITVLNDPLARELGLDPAALRSEAGVRALLGNDLAPGAKPVAQVYAGHQFGSYSARLGDGRALLLGELRMQGGTLVDIHLKGSGPTPFARGGDGFAALGPMLREYLVSEAMHALGIPTTRALAVITTGRRIARDGDLVPAAVLVRVAASHLRVGTFQYARATGDTGLLERLTRFALERHAPDRAAASLPALELLDHVVTRQASLVAQWTLAGFVHGVMNTDNMTISGETIDYGPCAFLDNYDPAAVFSSIDRQGRYAFGAQPTVAAWNLTRFAEALLPLVALEARATGETNGVGRTNGRDDAGESETSEGAVAAAREVLARFGPAYDAEWIAGMRTKLGLPGTVLDDEVVQRGTALLEAWQRERTDYTLAMREANAANPLYIARNALLEEALTQATSGDLTMFEEMLEAVARPALARAGFGRFAVAPEAGARPFVSYCGT